MLPLAGIILVFVAVTVGFLLESSNWRPLVQPAEIVIICGAAIGTLMAANPLPLLRETFRGVLRIFRGPPYSRESYLSTLVMLYEMFDFARRSGIGKLDDDLDNPGRNPVFARYPAILRDPGLMYFICDTLRMVAFGSVMPMDLDNVLLSDIESRRQGLSQRVRLLEALADSLPGFGIAAAVLGVVITMGSLSAPSAVIGQKVAAALVGTFLGILLSYGVVAPSAAHLEKRNEAEIEYYEGLRAGLVGFAKKLPVAISVELARRAVPSGLRPDFDSVESSCRKVSIRKSHAA